MAGLYYLTESSFSGAVPAGMTRISLLRTLWNGYVPTVTVESGAEYYFDSGVGGAYGSDIVFTADAENTPATFHFDRSNGNDFEIRFSDPLLSGSVTPTLIVDDGVALSRLSFDANNADGGLTATLGANASVQQILGDATASNSFSLGSGASVSVLTGGSVGDLLTMGPDAQAGQVSLGSGNDSVTMAAGAKITGLLDLGDGDDTLSVASHVSIATLDAGDGSLTLDGAAASYVTIGTITLDSSAGTETSTIVLGDHACIGNVTAGGDEREFITLGADSSIDNVVLNDGADTLTLGAASTAGSISMGGGGDAVIVGSAGTTGAIDMGAGGDGVILGSGASASSVTLGTGDDSLTLGAGAAVTGALDAGAGADTVTLAAGARIDGPIDLGSEDDTIYVSDYVSLGDIDAGDGAFNLYGETAQHVTLGDVFIDSDTDVEDSHILLGDYASVGDIDTGLFSNENETISLGAQSSIGNVSLGDGQNAVSLGEGSTGGTITTGSGADSVSVGAGGSVAAIDLGNGINSIELGDGATSGAVTTGSGEDTLILGAGARIDGPLNLGGDDDTLYVSDWVEIGDIDAGDGAFNLYGAEADDVTLGDITLDYDTDIEESHILLGDRATVGDVTAGALSDERETLVLGQDSRLGHVDLGDGNDALTLGQGSSVASIDLGHGADSLTIGETVSVGSGIVDLGEDIAGNDDTLTLMIGDINDPASRSEFGTALWAQGYRDYDHDGIYNYYDSHASNETFTWNGVTYVGAENIRAIVCFTADTLIRAESGEVAVGGCQPGDRVWTLDNGYQPIRWVGRRKLPAAALAANPHLRPIRLQAGCLGDGIPARDLTVSPQHRILVRSQIAERMFGTPEVLVAAKHLLAAPGVEVATDLAEVEYVHILFDSHEIVCSNGAETESLFTGPEALKAVSPAARDEILTLFPELGNRSYAPTAVRPLSGGRRGRTLVERHARNGKVLVAAGG